MGAGRSTRANLAARSAATVLWGAVPGDAYSLIVDGVHDADRTTDDAVALEVTSAVLHRLAGSPGDGPTCIRVVES